MLLMAIGIIVAYVLWFNINLSIQNAEKISRLRGYIEYNHSDSEQKERIEFHDQIIEIDSNYYWSYYNRGLDYFELGEFDIARKDLLYYIQLKPDAINGHLALAEIYRYQGMYEEAEEYIEKTLYLFAKQGYDQNELDESKLDGENFVSYFSIILERGQINYCKGDYGKAISDFTNCIKLKKTPRIWNLFRERCYYLRGMSYERIGEVKLAKKDFKEVSGYFEKEYYEDCELVGY